MNDTTNRLGALGAEPNSGGNGHGATPNLEAGSQQSGSYRLFNRAVLAYLSTKDEALKYVTARVRLSLAVLEALAQAQRRTLDDAIRFLRGDLANVEAELGGTPPMIPATEPIPRWPDSWTVRLLACILLVMIGGLAALGLVNSAQFAVLTTNNWWLAVLFAAPMLSVPFALKYVFEGVPPRLKPLVYASLGLIGAASVAAFIYTFANRFGVTTAMADPADVQALLSHKEDNRLQLAAQMLTELSCGTVLVLWFRKIMLGTIRNMVNPLRQPLEEIHSRKLAALKELEQQLGRVQGELAALPHRREAGIEEGLATWNSIKEENATRARLQEELAVTA